MKPVVFIPEPINACGIDLLQADCLVAAPWQDNRQLNDEALNELFYEADASITRLYPISQEKLNLCRKLKVIARHGVGVDMVDCQAATERGILVLNTPLANANSVAEHAIAMMMALAKQLDQGHQAVVSGHFHKRFEMEGVELAGKTLGIIGLGRIGSRVAHIAKHGLGMDVCGFDPFVDVNTYEGAATVKASLELVLRCSDFLSLHIPLSPETKYILNSQRLGQVKPGCHIVNTSRGGVIDERALARALESGTVAAAALDVFEIEPPPTDHPLCTAPNILLSPHTAALTRDAMDNMARDAAQGVLDFFQGRRPQHIVNPEVLS